MSVTDNFRALRQAIDQAARGRRVRLAGAAKDQPVEKVREAAEAGLEIVAMNYAQQGEALREALGETSVEWHFIGHIQSRKVKYLTAYDCVQSLDRLDIARSLDEKLASEGKKARVLVEVNLGDEPQKSGIGAAEVETFLRSLTPFTRLEVVGLMGMPPPLDPPEARRPFFKKLKALADANGLTELSMGTSEDFLVAVEEGATIVRLGTVLFGAREKHRQ